MLFVLGNSLIQKDPRNTYSTAQRKCYHSLVDLSLQLSLKSFYSKVSDASFNSTIKCPVIFCDIFTREPFK